MAHSKDRWIELQERIAYSFKDEEWLRRSLTHPSYLQSRGTRQEHNQRLEFLGDAILGMVLADILFHELPNEREGTLTRYRSILANGSQLGTLALELGLQNLVLMSDSTKAEGGNERLSILEDAFEALIAAVYLDGGYESAKTVIRKIYGNFKDRLQSSVREHNPKGQLQELLQPKLGNSAIEYCVVEESGPDHDKTFTVEIQIDGVASGKGKGPSKKLAEEEAARQALKSISDSLN